MRKQVAHPLKRGLEATVWWWSGTGEPRARQTCSPMFMQSSVKMIDVA